MIHSEKSQLARYAVATVIFWFAALVVFGGSTSDNGESIVRVGVIGALINGALLPMLWRGWEIPRILLVLESGLLCVVISAHALSGSLEAFDLLALVSGYQLFLLWRLGRGWRYSSDPLSQ